MVVFVNGREIETGARVLAELVAEQSMAGSRIATALNGQFVPETRRQQMALNPGDRIEIVSPRQGG